MRDILRRLLTSIPIEGGSAVRRTDAGTAPPPIIVLSFNRPDYLSQVLDTLAAQTALGKRPIFLFQDNAVSPYSGIRYARDEDVAACVQIFRSRFPAGTVMLAQHNLGIAGNFLRAEEFAFQELGNEVCYFFEDDMVLSPHYLTMMDQIASFALSNEKVGYFTAHGRLNLPLEKQRARSRLMGRMSLHWAFGLTRRHWIELRDWLEPYYRFLDGHDYKDKPSRKIAEHYRSQGIPVLAVNQDVMKKAGSYALGCVSLTTIACFGKYIGAEGFHHRQEHYDSSPYKNTVMYPEPIQLIFPTEEQLAAIHKSEMEIRWRRLEARVQKVPSLKDTVPMIAGTSDTP